MAAIEFHANELTQEGGMIEMMLGDFTDASHDNGRIAVGPGFPNMVI